MTLAAVPDIGRTTATIAEEIDREVIQAERNWRDALKHAIRAGELLIEAKGMVKHGEWLPWLSENFPGSKRCAQRYMKLALNAHDVAHLPTVTDALDALAKTEIVCQWDDCHKMATDRVARGQGDDRWSLAALNPDKSDYGFCQNHALAEAENRNSARERRIAGKPPPKPTEAEAEQAAVDEARHRAGEPYGIPPRRPEHVEKMHAPRREGPHPKLLAATDAPWVTECPCCGYDLYGRRGEDDGEVAGWLAASVAPMPERTS